MNKYETLSCKISSRIARKKDIVFLRGDFADLGGYDVESCFPAIRAGAR